MYYIQSHLVDWILLATHPRDGTLCSFIIDRFAVNGSSSFIQSCSAILTIDPLRINDAAHFVRSSSPNAYLWHLALRASFGHI
ncbi:hypothetical protein [Membranihabitans marinus]|uniref:hypothetical protein n=1 Tax=Membranihabitans marinus TaxID=1227546 RepID=UPI001F183BDC|nr:hypothetical protein [Membranihabitans marinus]